MILRVASGKQAGRDIDNRGYSEIASRLTDLNVSRKSLVAERGNMRTQMTGSILSLGQRHERMEYLMSQRQVANESVAQRLSSMTIRIVPCGTFLRHLQFLLCLRLERQCSVTNLMLHLRCRCKPRRSMILLRITCISTIQCI